MPENKQNQKQIQIKAQDEVLKGAYANAVQITHTQEEFILDFMNIYPWQGLGVLTGRMIVSPAHMKRMVKALEENMKKYEDQYGQVSDSSEGFDKSIGFKTE